MKNEHLLNLPHAPAAAEVVRKEDFKPRSRAWLNTVWQNWCTYGHEYPQKHTIIFTTLTREAFPDRRCAKHCKRSDKDSNKQHGVKVADVEDSFERSKWPREFVNAALRACVGDKPYVGL